MPLNDDNMGWNRKRVFIPIRNFSGVLDDNTSGVPASLGAGVPVFAEISAAFELAGMQIAAAGDEVYHFMPIPWDMDTTQPMRFRVWFIHTSTDADIISWKLDYKFIAKQAALSDARSSADEAMTFANHTCSTTANSMEVTAWKESNSHDYWRNGDFALALALEADSLGDGSANELLVLGLEIQYTVKAMTNQARQFTEGQPTSDTYDPNV